MSELHYVEWDHPAFGYIKETVCPFHEQGLLSAMRALGIGCLGSTAPASAACLRCSSKREPREFLADVASVQRTLRRARETELQ